MPAATRTSLERLHVLLVEQSLAYLRDTPPEQRRPTRMMLIRRLLKDSQVGTDRQYSRRFKRTLDRLYTAYAEGLIAQVQAGDMRPGVISEVRLFLRAHRINAQSIDAARAGTSETTAEAPQESSKLVLPFTADGERSGSH